MVAAAMLVAASRPAEARIVDVRAGLRAGGIDGWGGNSSTPDFFNKTNGGAAGFDVGARLLIFGVSASFLQVLNGDGRVGTLTQFLGGVEIDVPVGQRKLRSGKSQNIFRPGLMGGIAFGTAGPVHPPLDDAQVSDKGIVTQLELAYEHFIGPFLGVGFEGDLGWHYFLGGKVVNTSRGFSTGPHLVGLATLTFHLGY